MTPNEFLEGSLFGYIIGASLAILVWEYEARKLRAWKKEAAEVLAACKPHLKSIPRMQENGFHLARTVKHLEQRLAKFGPKPRGEGGRFLRGGGA